MNDVVNATPAAIVVVGDADPTEVSAKIRDMTSGGAHPVMVYGDYASAPQVFADDISRLGENTPVVVCDTSRFDMPAGFVKTLAGKARKGVLLGLSGFRVVDGVKKAGRIVQAEMHDRRPRMPRYRRNDAGDVAVDVLTSVCCCATSGDLSSILETDFAALSSPTRLTTAAKLRGIGIVCPDMPVEWARPVMVQAGNVGAHLLTEDEAECLCRGLTEPTPGADSYAPTTVLYPDLWCPPDLSVVFITHNRTAVAAACLSSMMRNIRYSGRLHWCICDDRSEAGHVEALSQIVRNGGADSFSVLRTDSDRYGLGASMNNGLARSFEFTDCVLTAEDDFLMTRPASFDGLVRTLQMPSVAGIKLAFNDTSTNPVVPSRFPGYSKVTGNKGRFWGFRYTFNNLVMLRHRRVFDRIGMYLENRHPDIVEMDAIHRFNTAFDSGMSDEMQILWPNELRLDTYDSGMFVHIGVSTLGHRSGRPPAEFLRLNDPSLDRRLREAALSREAVDTSGGKSK